ncbi:Variant-specific surface protein [Giardia duodenalis]|uniref:Variant-specific surface protein n=1 Tax=Giardia intestinalis TaxID=5741 RepID=V6U1I7_GIAIN|nr:Variant-specific surface protein [Giardia intestinalis]
MLAIYFAVGALAAACKSVSQTSTCAQCEMVGEVEVCTECKNTGNVPINGQCTTVANAANCKKVGGGELDPNAQTCGQCTDAYFLYKGGCYQIGQSPGNLICADKQASGTTGTCKACAEGYFMVSSATATQDSCVACGDENCATCTEGTTPQKCSKCKTTGTKTYLKGSAGTGTCVAADGCGDGSYADAPSKECKACHGDCATCVGAENVDCTKCKANNSKDYLKVLDAEDGSGQCVATEEECKSEGTYFLVTDTATSTKTCYPCEASSRGGVTNCLTCTAPGTAATATCTACTEGYTLNSQANTCASSSANRSALSTGAIAGISVAVIVVVGGLVEFLCWWFVCRRKV